MIPIPSATNRVGESASLYATPAPLRQLALIHRLRAAGCQFRLSLNLLARWARDTIAACNASADRLTAFEQEIHARRQRFDLAFSNDAPALRRELTAVLDQWEARLLAEARAHAIQVPMAFAESEECLNAKKICPAL